MANDTQSPRKPSWLSIPAPRAVRDVHEIEQLGRTRTDPYAWLKFIPESRSRTLDVLPPYVSTQIEAEMAYADSMLAPLAPAIAHFHQQMRLRAPEVEEPAPLRPHGWHYGSRLPAGAAHRQFIRTAPDGEEQLLFDEAERADGHAYYRATDHQHSPDDHWFAWAEDIVGDDRHRICLLDMVTGAVRIAAQSDAFGYGGLAFSPSSAHLFWIWRDAHSRPTRLYRTAVATGETALVHEESDPAIFMQVTRTAAGGFIALTLAGPDTSEVRLIDADAETTPPRIVRPRVAGTRYWVEEWADDLLMLTDADGAVDRKLVALDPVTFAERRELVPHRSGVPIIRMLPFAKALVLLERHDGLLRLALHHPDGRETSVAFDDPAYTIEVAQDQHYDAAQIRIVHQNPASPPRWIDVDFATGARRTAGQEVLRHLDPDAYRVERLEAQAPDGVMVPITLLSRRDQPPGVPLPLLLNGYGAYGYCREPDFSLPVIALVDAGFRYAIAHVRGGAERGQGWFLDGRRMKKRNSMTDFIACAHHLVDTGYAEPGRIVAHGISAGGLLVCGAMNIEPELWAGVIAQVPFVDMLNTMSDADHPLVPLFRPDWGDPLADPEAYDYIASISPYENVRAAAYPPLLCTAGLKDDRVPYWEPAKLIANLRHLSTSDSPAILHLDLESGHQASGDQDSIFAQAALLWAFAQHCVRANEA